MALNNSINAPTTFAVNKGGTGTTTSTGTGSVVLSTSPSLTTPNIDAATATSITNAFGSTSAPSYTFSGETNTGMYRFLSNRIGFTANGTTALVVVSSGIYVVDGTVSLPSYSFLSDTNTGLYSSSADHIGVACNGINSAIFASTGLTLPQTTNQLVLGTTNTTTINSAAPAASRTVNLNDAGAASNMVLSDTSNTKLLVGPRLYETTNNTVVGNGAGSSGVLNDTVVGLTAFGVNAGSALSGAADRNVFVGKNAGQNTTTSTDLVFVGSGAGTNNGGVNNVGIGTNALSGGGAVGSVTGTGNNAIGSTSLTAITSGSNNNGFGRFSGASLSTGSDNTFIGDFSGDGATGTAITTGGQNTFLGSNTDANSASASNRTAIGYGAVGTANNQIMIGNSSVTQIVKNSSATVDIGTLTNQFNNIYANSETLKNTTNQITLGTTNTVTINSTAPAASRTYLLPDTLGAATFQLSYSRAYSSVSLAFNTSRTPNSTRDVLVVASISIATTSGQTGTVVAQVDTGAGFSTIATMNAVLNAALDNMTNVNNVTFIVPYNASYKFVSSGSATNAITSIFELVM